MSTVNPLVAREPIRRRRERPASERVIRNDAERQRERVRASLLLLPGRSRSSR